MDWYQIPFTKLRKERKRKLALDTARTYMRLAFHETNRLDDVLRADGNYGPAEKMQDYACAGLDITKVKSYVNEAAFYEVLADWWILRFWPLSDLEGQFKDVGNLEKQVGK